MKYFIFLPLLLLLGCKLEEPKVVEQYNCQLPTTISVTKDPINGKKFSFVISQQINDIASFQWIIKSANGTVVSTSNTVDYALTLAAEGQYSVQANLTSKCGENKILSADFEATSVCNLIKNEVYFRAADGYEALDEWTFTHNALNEVIKEEVVTRHIGQITSASTYTYQKTEANLGSLTQPYILRIFDNNYIIDKIYCDSKKRIVKTMSSEDSETTFSYDNDGFLEQEITLYKSSQIEYRKNYKYAATGVTVTITRLDRKTNESRMTEVKVSLYSDKPKLPKYEVNYGYSRGKQPPKYFKSEERTVYENGRIFVYKTEYIVVLDNNNQPVSEKTITNNYSSESRKFIFDCK